MIMPISLVSIHAPAWGATITRIEKEIGEVVSIHAPAWGATLANRRKMICETCFNPRTRVGCDRGFETCTCPNTVSIHAPAWGATNAFAFRAYNYIWFQSTHPRGVRLLALVSLRPMQRFNPRTRVGCDLAAAFSSPCRKLVSIHAPAWGATCYRQG